MKLSLKTILQILSKGKSFTTNSLCFLAFQQTDLFIAQRMLSANDAGAYAVARNIVFQIGNVIYIGVAKYTNSKIAHHHRTDGIDSKQRIRYKKNYMVVAIAFAICSCLLSPIFIEVAYGKSWLSAIATVQILLLGCAARLFSIPSNAHIIAKHGIRPITISNTIGLFAIAALGPAGTYFNGVNGLAAASATTITIIAILQTLMAK